VDLERREIPQRFFNGMRQIPRGVRHGAVRDSANGNTRRRKRKRRRRRRKRRRKSRREEASLLHRPRPPSPLLRLLGFL